MRSVYIQERKSWPVLAEKHSSHWWFLRMKRPLLSRDVAASKASRFHSACHSDLNNPKSLILALTMKEYGPFTSPATEYGNNMRRRQGSNMHTSRMTDIMTDAGHAHLSPWICRRIFDIFLHYFGGRSKTNWGICCLCSILIYPPLLNHYISLLKKSQFPWSGCHSPF